MQFKIIIALLAVVLSGALWAAPAHWYKWRSKLTGEEFCAQTSPGPGWEKVPQPYRNARCAAASLPIERASISMPGR